MVVVPVFCLLLFLQIPVALAQQPPSPFVSIPPATSDELRFGIPFPEFEAKDITGRTWRREDLRGKFTVMYIWHTFQVRVSGPVQRDLPELQRFYDKVRNAKNIQVLTFCMDYDYMHAHDYMKQKQYTFPVIADWALLSKLFPPDECRRPCSVGLPTATGQRIAVATPYWVVNPEGRLSYPLRTWSLGGILSEIEKEAAAP